jgi:uncharacterized membrane protein YagU involved in acid resistance
MLNILLYAVIFGIIFALVFPIFVKAFKTKFLGLALFAGLLYFLYVWLFIGNVHFAF